MFPRSVPIPRTFARTVAAIVIAALGACATTPPPAPQLPAVPAAFRGTETAAFARPDTARATPTPLPADGWWRVFADPALDAIVTRAMRENTTIAQAAARVGQARALASAAGANRLPQAGLAAGASRQGGPLINAAGAQGTLLTAGTSVAWELDVFGRLSGAARAATLDAGSRESLLAAARLVVQAEIVQTYLAIRATDEERALVRATADAHRETIALVERRRRAGFVPDVELARARAEASATDADALALDRRRAELAHALAFLAGDVASTFEVPTAEWTAALPGIPAGIPSTMLARRPDVAAAQTTLEATQVRLGVAQTAWFPTFGLTANGGVASSDLAGLLRTAARSWGVTALLAAPLFDGGRRAAGVEAAEADIALAVAEYRERILVAFRETEDQLDALRILAEQDAALVEAAAQATRTTGLLESRYRNGLVGQLDVLDARRTELRNRRAAIQARSARFIATVGLVRALGGGWEAPAAVGFAPPEPVAAGLATRPPAMASAR